MIGVIYS